MYEIPWKIVEHELKNPRSITIWSVIFNPLAFWIYIAIVVEFIGHI